MRRSSPGHATIASSRCPSELAARNFGYSYRPSSEGTFYVTAPGSCPICAVDRGLGPGEAAIVPSAIHVARLLCFFNEFSADGGLCTNGGNRTFFSERLSLVCTHRELSLI